MKKDAKSIMQQFVPDIYSERLNLSFHRVLRGGAFVWVGVSGGSGVILRDDVIVRVGLKVPLSVFWWWRLRVRGEVMF